MTLPDGPAPRPFTLEEGWRRQRAATDAARQRGVLNTATTPVVVPWSQYKRPSGSNLTALTWTKIGGYVRTGGAGVGLTLVGGADWTLAAGIWQVKASLRASGSGNIMIGVSPETTGILSVYPGGEASFPGVAIGAGIQPSSVSLDIVSDGTNTVTMYGAGTANSPIVDGAISFYKIG